jgi:hypothetical protein
MASALAQSTQSKLDALRRACSIAVQTDNEKFPAYNNHGRIDGANPDAASLKNYLPMFVEEFSLYPPECIKRSDLKKVIVCKSLRFAEQLRSAIPDYAHDTLYLDCENGIWSSAYMRHTVHHEYFHIIDWKDDGRVYEDKEWSALNPKGFKYGTGGKNNQDNDAYGTGANLSGFLSAYATTGVEEDKAEMFANMMVRYKAVERRAQADAVIASKFARMKELLKQFCPEMDDAFWRKISERGIDDSEQTKTGADDAPVR